MIETIIILAWLVCGILGYGLCYGFFCGEYPFFRQSLMLPVLSILLGPIGILTDLIMFARGHTRVKLRYRPQTLDEVWLAHRAMWPSISYSEFLSKVWHKPI